MEVVAQSSTAGVQHGERLQYSAWAQSRELRHGQGSAPIPSPLHPAQHPQLAELTAFP